MLLLLLLTCVTCVMGAMPIIFMSLHRRGGGTYCFWCGSYWHWDQRDAFLCARYLMNKWVDWNQICMDITLRHEKFFSFWRPWPNFQGSAKGTAERNRSNLFICGGGHLFSLKTILVAHYYLHKFVSFKHIMYRIQTYYLFIF